MDVNKTYRNIYIKEGIVPRFDGNTIVHYTGKVVYNCPAGIISMEYDRNSDAVISCGCDFHKIKALCKKNE